MQENLLKELRGVVFSGQDLENVTAPKYKDLKGRVKAQMEPVLLPDVGLTKLTKLRQSRERIQSLIGSHPEYLLNEFSGHPGEKPFDSLVAAFGQGGRNRDKIAAWIKYLQERARRQETKDTKDRLFEKVGEFAQFCEEFLLKDGFEALYPMLRREWEPVIDKIVADINKASGINVITYRDLAESCYQMMSQTGDELKFQRILALIHLRCKEVGLDVPSVRTSAVCPKCGDKGQTGAICTKCRARIKCGCGHVLVKDSTICGGCGTAVNDIDTLLEEIKNADRALAAADCSTAERLIAPVKIKWARNESVAGVLTRIAALRAKEEEQAIDKIRRKNLQVGHLECRMNGRQVELRWDRVSCEGVQIKYIVTRQDVTDNRPQIEVGQTSSNTLGDTIKSGVSCFYFVSVQWSVVGSNVSGAWDGVRSPEVLAPGEVSNPRVVAGDGKATIDFTPHPHAADYELLRADSKGRSERVAANLRGGKFTDTGLQNGERYTYTLVSVFKKSSGETLRSDGVTLYATPTVPPVAVKELTFTRNGNVVTFSWDGQGKKGDCFRILHSTIPLSTSLGSAVPLVELEKMGTVFTPPLGGTAECTIPRHSEKSYFSVWSVGGDLAIAGARAEEERRAAVKVDFVAARKKGLFSADRWIVELKAQGRPPCDLWVLVGEGIVESNPKNYRPALTIPRNELAPGGSKTFEVTHKQRDKNKKLIFRIVPSSLDYRDEVAVIPEIKTITR